MESNSDSNNDTDDKHERIQVSSSLKTIEQVAQRFEKFGLSQSVNLAATHSENILPEPENDQANIQDDVSSYAEPKGVR